MASPDKIKQLSALVDRLASIDPETLSRRADVGKNFAFEDTATFACVRDFFLTLRPAALASLPDELVDTVFGPTQAMQQRAEQISRYEASPPNAQNERELLTRSFRAAFLDCVQKWAPILTLFRQLSIDSLVDEAKKHLALVTAISDDAAAKRGEFERELAAFRVEKESLLEPLRLDSLERAVAEQSSFFRTQAKAHDESAESWLAVTVALASALVLIGVWLAAYPSTIDQHAGLANAFLAIAPRLLAAAAGLYLLTLSSRNYRAHRHNAVIYRHREKAISTFEYFRNAGSAKETKDALLLQAASVAFSIQPTGYLPSEPETPPHSIIVEALAKLK